MKRLGLICLTVCCLGALTGCMFSKKSAKKRSEATTVADMEQDFRQRWIEKRTAELTSPTVNAETARAQATAEFKTRYGYTNAAGRP